MGALEKINLLSVILSIITFGALGFVVYFNNKKSATNRAFLFFAAIEIIWNIVNYLSYQLSPKNKKPPADFRERFGFLNK